MLPRSLCFQMIMSGDSRFSSKRWTMGIRHNTQVVVRSSLPCGYFVHHVLLPLGESNAGQTWRQGTGTLWCLYLLLWREVFPPQSHAESLVELWGLPSAFSQQSYSSSNLSRLLCLRQIMWSRVSWCDWKGVEVECKQGNWAGTQVSNTSVREWKELADFELWGHNSTPGSWQ